MSKNRTRNNRIVFCLNDEELQCLEQKMEKMEKLGVKNREGFIRKMVMDGYIINIDTSPMLHDELGWINSPARLNNALRDFHQRTGIWTTLYITDNIRGQSYSVDSLRRDRTVIDSFMLHVFNNAINNGAHMLVLVYDDGRDWDVFLQIGAEASLVMDIEAEHILIGYMERHWEGNTDDDAEMFSRVFQDTSRRIMQVTRPWWHIPLILVLVLCIGAGGFFWWTRKKKQQNLEAEQTERILAMPMETIGDNHDEASQLAQEYDENDSY